MKKKKLTLKKFLISIIPTLKKFRVSIFYLSWVFHFSPFLGVFIFHLPQCFIFHLSWLFSFFIFLRCFLFSPFSGVSISHLSRVLHFLPFSSVFVLQYNKCYRFERPFFTLKRLLPYTPSQHFAQFAFINASLRASVTVN